jgi:single-strand DNA-binding protein
MLNNVVLIGRLVAHPELRTTPQGTSVTTFRIAVDRAFQSKDQEKQADFIDIVAWRQQAEFVTKYFTKGSLISVIGSIQTRSYNDKDGNKRTAFEISADRLGFVGSKNDNPASNPNFQRSSSASQQPAPSYSSATSADFEELPEDDDLPF